MRGLPCLRLEDPSCGEVVIETSASGLLLDTEETLVFSGLKFAHDCAKASLPQWSNYEQSDLDHPDALPYPFPDKGHLLYLFVDPLGMMRNKITYATCGNWVNPSVVRKVIQNIYERCSTSNDFSQKDI